MEKILIIIAIVLVVIAIDTYKNHKSTGRHRRRDRRRTDFVSTPMFDQEAISWCANLLSVEIKSLKKVLYRTPSNYTKFRIPKRSGGHRFISAPKDELQAIQRTIYYRILLPVNLHPAATGFRKGKSIIDNAKVHLNKKHVLKTDIKDFFDSIRIDSVVKAFENIGYQNNIAKVLAHLCCLRGRLPQGAPTSPALSNIIAYNMDKKLTALAREYGLTYTRYADDLTFSSYSIELKIISSKIEDITEEEGFFLNDKKTRFLTENKRKIITGISISSGEKMTVPKAKKRELRKNIHFILTKGLSEHQKYIGSTDPAYLKRIMGYLNFWQSVEPYNRYVADSIKALNELNSNKKTPDPYDFNY